MDLTPLSDRTLRRLASVEAAGNYADINARTVRRYIAQGRLTGYRVGPRLIRVDLNELDDMMCPIPTGGHNGAA